METENDAVQEQEVPVDDSQAAQGETAPDENQNVEESGEQQSNSDPLYVQKRLKQQQRKHEREVRDLQAKMADMQSMLGQTQNQTNQNYDGRQYESSGIDEQIHKAVSYALNHRDMEERKAKEVQSQQHVQKQYKELYKHLDSMGDKYDDFHDVVFGDDTQFTPAMRDYAMTLPKQGKGSAGEVLYKLGKNNGELERISRLHPLDQATEMAKLSHALISSEGSSKSTQSKTMGNVKSSPMIASGMVTDKTPIGSLRQRMKSGSWK